MTTEKRPRLLFLCQTLPYPPIGGVEIRTYNILRLLTRVFEVRALCFYRRKGGWVDRDLAANVHALRKLVPVEAFPIPQEHDRTRLLWDHLRSLLLNRVHTVYAYQSDDFRTRLASTLASQEFDVVHVDSLDLSAYLPMLNGHPVVCVHHNVESMLLRRRAEYERTTWRRLYVRRQAALMEREERLWCQRLALNVTVSQEDRMCLAELAPEAACTVVPNGVDVEQFRPGEGEGDGIVFVGGTKSFANRDALQYFCTRILPLVRRAGASPVVRWVGLCTERDRTLGQSCDVELTGYVNDIRPYVHGAACYVAPLRVGGGTRLKILDAWAMGKAVVSTSIGCEGLAAVDGENIVIRDEPDAFAEAVVEVLHNQRLRRNLGDAARATAERLYSWEVIGEKMNRTYLSLTRCDT